MIAQACHASLSAYKKAGIKDKLKWELTGSKKVVLKCNSEEELLRLNNEARRLPHYLVRDAGLTQVKPGTITALAIGPASDEEIDKITSELKLL